jgi:hypothetical protein
MSKQNVEKIGIEEAAALLEQGEQVFSFFHGGMTVTHLKSKTDTGQTTILVQGPSEGCLHIS